MDRFSYFFQLTCYFISDQSVKTTEKGGLKGYDGAKKIKEGKRHFWVDTQVNPLGVLVNSVSEQDGASPLELIQKKSEPSKKFEVF